MKNAKKTLRRTSRSSLVLRSTIDLVCSILVNGVAPQVNHVRESNKRHEENEANVLRLCDTVFGIAEQLDNFVVASTYNVMNAPAPLGDIYYDCLDHVASMPVCRSRRVLRRLAG